MNKFQTRVMARFFPETFWNNTSKNVKDEKYRVVFVGLGKRPFLGGKVEPWKFFPPFCNRLANAGVSYAFSTTPERLLPFDDVRNAFVHVYREVTEVNNVSAILPRLPKSLHFNHPLKGTIVADKQKTNKLLSNEGVAMPGLLVAEKSGRVKVFSNANCASGADVQVLEPHEELDRSRYNTEFIDTRIKFRGVEYYTCVRVMTVGPNIVHAYCRARPVSENSASVHNQDTPLDPELIEHLQKVKVEPFMEDFSRIALLNDKALGLGFFALDIVVSSENDRAFLVEPGYKFNDPSYVEHLRPIAHELPSHAILFSDKFAEKSADLFLRNLGIS